MIELNNITKIYNKGKSNELKALNNVTLKINAGELIALIGTSGAGKSTLMHILGCLDTYDHGEYFLEGKNILQSSDSELSKIRNKKFGIILQDFALIDFYSVIDNVMIPLRLFRKKKSKEKALKALETVGIKQLRNQQTSTLSGGQKQRVAIARAIVNEAKIILADEPTGALDSETSNDIMNLFLKLNIEENKTIIIITHDDSIAKKCNRIIRLNDGEIVEDIIFKEQINIKEVKNFGKI